MPHFRTLFSFKKREVEQAFATAQLHRKRYGIRLLMAPLSPDESSVRPAHGKLLVIAPRRVGNAPTRNLLRRRLKAIYYQEKLYHVPALAIIILYEHAATLTFDELKTFLTDALLSWKPSKE